jgi:hypothetical protein
MKFDFVLFCTAIQCIFIHYFSNCVSASQLKYAEYVKILIYITTLLQYYSFFVLCARNIRCRIRSIVCLEFTRNLKFVRCNRHVTSFA